MTKWAIYRIHYGLDFLKQSIDSIKNSVDKVFVIYSVHPWVYRDTVNYMGVEIPMHPLPDDVFQFMYDNYRAKQKVSYWRSEFTTPANQFRLLYDQCVEKEGSAPDMVLFMEPDMVYYKPMVDALFEELDQRKDIPCLGSLQIELWKNTEWRIPQRDRIGPMIWHTKRAPDFKTHFGTWHPQYQLASSYVQNYNFGFCLNSTTMLYKHLTAINFSAAIGDSIPSQEWYMEKWLKWTPETTDLEIAEKWKHLIPRAEIYNMPIEMKTQMELSCPR